MSDALQELGALIELKRSDAVIATEAVERAQGLLPSWCQLPVTPQTVSHDEFKRLTQQARVMVRTGECTPYANVILVAGVTF